mgnify:CR=1 FL=1|tara:strand:+ start:6577 stop:7713 length:1137 start_codon:yes stop_codon:yes gene_type:complete
MQQDKKKWIDRQWHTDYGSEYEESFEERKIRENRKSKLFSGWKEKRAEKLRNKADKLDPPKPEPTMGKGVVESLVMDNFVKGEDKSSLYNYSLEDEKKQVKLADLGFMTHDEVDGKWGPQSVQMDSLYVILKGKGFDDKTITARNYAEREGYSEKVLNLLDPVNGEAGKELFMYATTPNLQQFLTKEEKQVLFKDSLPKQIPSGRGDRMVDAEYSDASVEDIVMGKMESMDKNKLDEDKIKHLYGKVGLAALDVGRYTAGKLGTIGEKFEKIRNNPETLARFLGLSNPLLVEEMVQASKFVVKKGSEKIKDMKNKNKEQVVPWIENQERLNESKYGRKDIRQATNQEIVNPRMPGELRREAEEAGLEDKSPYVGKRNY